MKLIILLTLVFSFNTFAEVSAQHITLKAENITLGNVMKEIQAQQGYSFFFRGQDIANTRVRVNVRNANLTETMAAVLAGQGLDWTVKGETIIIKRRLPSNASPKGDDTADPIQELVITGSVVDEAGNPLEGVTVTAENTRNVTMTAADGTYRIEVARDIALLSFAAVGYHRSDQSIGNRRTIDVVMKVAVSELDEVVVVGYGTVRKEDLTGAVGSLKSEEFNQGVTTTVQQLMQGKMPGVQVVQNDGKPGGGISVNIRGVGSINSGTGPLYVIDGLPSENIDFINPMDIESIEVLKDASATAIYGARGANGVVLLTTKKGSIGKLRLDYDAYVGTQRVVNRLDVLTPDEYMHVINDLIDGGGGAVSERVTTIQNGGTDWQDMVYHQGAVVQNHNLSFSGGAGQTRYYVGLNHMNQDGVVKNTAFQRYSARINIEHRVKERFNVGLNLSTSYIKDQNIPSGFAINESGGVLYAAYNYDPTIAGYNDDGSYNRSPFMTMDSPLALLYGKNTLINRYKTFGTLFGEYFLLPELSIRLNVGGDINSHENDRYVDKTTIEGSANDGVGTFSRNSNGNYLVEGLVNYNKAFNNQSLTAVFGVTTQRFLASSINGSGRGFPNDVTRTYNFGSADPLLYTMESSKLSYQLLSYLGRLNYSLFNKYLLTASFRIDGSSRFGANNRFGYFPSVAGAWKIEEEDFFQPLRNTINTLKLRASWGRTGNQEIGYYEAITTFGNGPVAVFDDAQVKTLQPTRIGNPDLRWETTEQINAGLDFGLLNNRLQGSFDYFRKTTFDMLLNLPIPTSTGYPTQRQNVGEIANSGFEFGLTSTNIERKDISWTTSLMFNTLKNEVINLAGIPQIISGNAGFSNQLSIIQEKMPLRSFYGYEIVGIWQEGDDYSQTTDNVNPGDFKYRDVDGNGTVNADDRVVLGNSFPTFIWSLGNTFRWKDLSLYVFFEGQNGVSMFNGNLAETYYPISLRRNRLAEPLLNRWTPDNPSTVYPSFITPIGQGQKSVNNYTVEDASYIRLNTVKLSYNLPVNGRFFQSATIYVTGQNLMTWSDYQGIDPAANPNGGTDLRIDFNVYPLARTFMGGVNLTF